MVMIMFSAMLPVVMIEFVFFCTLVVLSESHLHQHELFFRGGDLFVKKNVLLNFQSVKLEDFLLDPLLTRTSRFSVFLTYNIL